MQTQLPSAVRAREAARRRTMAKRRRGRRRMWLWVTAVIVLVVGAIVARQILSNKAGSDLDRLALASGCAKVQFTGSAGEGQHLQPGERTRYDSSPPTHGAHSQTPLAARIYDKPFSEDPMEEPTIYNAVHSLEHGYVIVWHNRLTRDELRLLERTYRNEAKVIVVPYPKLKSPNKVALTAWGRLVDCRRPSTKVIDAFIDRFREARTAPEPKAP